MQSVTATSSTILLTQPDFSLPVNNQTVMVAGSSQANCHMQLAVNRPTVTATSNVTSVEFIDLQEFSAYNVTVTTVFDGYGLLTIATTFQTVSDS